MTLAIGWQWSFWLVAIFTAVLLPAVVLFCPETTYIRHLDPDLTSTDGSSESTDISLEKKSDTELQEHVVDHVDHKTCSVKFLSRQSLQPFNGRKTDEAFWKLFLRPFPLFLHPTVFWGCLIQGTVIAWTVLVGVMIALIAVQWNFNEADTGYLYTGPFIGALLGMLFSGLLSDSSAKWLAKLNGGICTPSILSLSYKSAQADIAHRRARVPHVTHLAAFDFRRWWPIRLWHHGFRQVIRIHLGRRLLRMAVRWHGLRHRRCSLVHCRRSSRKHRRSIYLPALVQECLRVWGLL